LLLKLELGTRDGGFDDDIHRGQFSGSAAADSWIKAIGIWRIIWNLEVQVGGG
jgi:hypothetical protein